jgi:hypothetical protein
VLHPAAFDSPRLVDDVLALVRERRPTGLLLSPPVGDVAARLDALDAADQDYARLSALDPMRPGPLIAVDDRAAARDLTNYLLDLATATPSSAGTARISRRPPATRASSMHRSRADSSWTRGWCCRARSPSNPDASAAVCC